MLGRIQGHSCGHRAANGTVACWGDDDDGEATPPSGTFMAVSAGSNPHLCACARMEPQYVGEQTTVPRPRRRVEHSTAVSSADGRTCALRSSGEIACWGRGADGVMLPATGAFTSVGIGWQHACAVRVGGDAECWGRNDHGEATPPTGSFQSVSVGGFGWRYSCGVRAGGAVECWGSDVHGRTSPPPGTFVTADNGGDHSCGIRTNGNIACWGNSDDGKTRPPPGTFTAVSAGPTSTPARSEWMEPWPAGDQEPSAGLHASVRNLHLAQRR